MKVSVIVPTLNEECYLEINLISVRKQTYGEIELIVSNGKSEDRTVKIAGKYTDMIEVNNRRNVNYQKNRGALISKLNQTNVGLKLPLEPENRKIFKAQYIGPIEFEC